MHCKKYQDLISLYIDGMLTNEELSDFESHINKCNICKEEVKIMQDILRKLKNIEEKSLPDNFHNELMEEIRKESMSNVSPLSKNKKWVFNYKIASALAAVFIFSIILINPLKDKSKEEAIPEMAGNIAQTRMMDLPAEESIVESREEVQNINHGEWTIGTSDLDDYQNILIDEIEKIGLEILVNQELFKEEQVLDSVLLELELDKDNMDYLERIIRDLEKTDTFEKLEEASSQKEGSIIRLVIIINKI